MFIYLLLINKYFMKNLLFLYIFLSTMLLVWCATNAKSTIECPRWSEYKEEHYDNWNLKSQWCFKIGENIVEWHRISYYENWGKDSEWDMVNNKNHWTWTFYDEEGTNTIEIIGNYKDDLEDWEWRYYEDWIYDCSDIFLQWELTGEGTC